MKHAIHAIYVQVGAPEWAAANLDALVDVLRDLSWLPPGPVVVTVPVGLDAAERARLVAVLQQAVADSARSQRPVRLGGDDGAAARDGAD